MVDTKDLESKQRPPSGGFWYNTNMEPIFEINKMTKQLEQKKPINQPFHPSQLSLATVEEEQAVLSEANLVNYGK